MQHKRKNGYSEPFILGKFRLKIQDLSPAGWLKTGNRAIREKDGFYYFVDRKKDMFVSGY
jgi:acyl-CoA synthetase (AMP-forming)/AMP-acid ligase II